MKLNFVNGNVRARCPDCAGAITTFESRNSSFGGSPPFGVVQRQGPHEVAGTVSTLTTYYLLKCAGCDRGGLAAVLQGPKNLLPVAEFFPRSIDSLQVPTTVPDDITAEFQEAETVASVSAWRAGSALLRSTLEKTLRANGYKKGSLADRIDEAAADGVITEARSQRAHQDIRVLGNDVLHDDWRPVTQDEFDQAHKYAQRILEDFYDDRPSVEALLKAKQRLP